jgi:presqualene diphosphate synthase
VSALRADTDAALVEVREAVAAAGTSFYSAMRMLPRQRRDAMFAIYAFCRVIDDIADGNDAPAVKLAELAAWRREVAAIYAGTPSRPLARILAAAVDQYRLRQADFIALIDGMEMDAREDIVAPALVTLDLYCDRVASAVGRLSVRIFGDDSPDADSVASSLGRALQLTNILRDLEEDAARGRLYLPRELLLRNEVKLGTPRAMLAQPAIAAVCEELADIAERRYAEAWWMMKHCRRRAMRPARVMASVYKATLVRLRRRGWKRLDKPVSAPRVLKIWFALRYGLL